MFQSVAGGLVAIWILARSNLSTRRRIKVEINNPYDQKTAGFIQNGRPVQPTYGKIKVFFDAPDPVKKCKKIGRSDDGHIEIYVFKIGDSNQRVDITVPNGEVGAGKVFNRSNWFRPNSGDGYYVIRRKLKTWNGSEYPSNYPGSYQQFGLNNYFYETAQRYAVYQNEDDAIESGESILNDYNLAVADNGGGGGDTPPPVAPDDPNNPPEPDPVPVDPGGLGGGVGGGFGGIGAFSAQAPPQTSFGMNQAEAGFTEVQVDYDQDFMRVSTFDFNEEMLIAPKKKKFDPGFGTARSERRGEEERREEGGGEELSAEQYYEQFRSSEGARAGGFRDYMLENNPSVDTSSYDFEQFP